MSMMSMAQAISEAQAEEMERDERVFVLGEDVGVMGGAFNATDGLFKRFGCKRVIDMPISEAGILGAGIGAALAGMRPVVEMQYGEFLGYMDPLANHMSKMHYMTRGRVRLPMVLRLPNGGKLGNAAPHSQYLEAWFMHMPGLRVAMPSNPRDAKGMLKAAIRSDDPVVFIEDKLLYPRTGEVPEGEVVPLGKAAVANPGTAITVVAVGWTVSRALAAARELEAEGIQIEVIDPRTLNPLDMDTIVESVRKTGKAIVAHQACRTGGVGAEISARIAEDAFEYLDAPVKRVTGMDCPIPYNIELEKMSLPDEKEIAQAVRDLVGREHG
ncbi:MAG TPA: alpha-ketoacid dehydrogenase subunit beta [Spirochaetia bacterium]|nr:alpha-ketoacid dehydrogenase subunit beta [Spirochaetia bacterium]